MNELVEKLLTPLPGAQPCGPDLSDRSPFEELERLLKGKPEIEVGSVKKVAEAPDWRDLKARSAEYLAQSKHLRAAMIFCGSSLQTGGLAGFRDGVQLVRGLVEQYWPTVHPPLDVEDNNDPTQRLNILGALNAPRGTLRPDIQQWLGIIDYLYATPLCRPKGAAPITLDLAIAAHRSQEGRTEGQGNEGTPGLDLVQLAKAFRGAPGSEVETNLAAVCEALEAITAIDQFLAQTLGANNSISFEEIRKVLQEIQGVLKAHQPGAAAPGTPADPAASDSATSGAGGTTAMQIGGSIRSREDVLRAIDAICEYYRQAEPSSPVPYLLRRAQKVAQMNFVQSMQELNLASVDALRPAMGSALDSDPLPG